MEIHTGCILSVQLSIPPYAVVLHSCLLMMETLQQLTLSLNIGVKGGLKVWTGSGSILEYISWSKLLVCSIVDRFSTCSSFCLSTRWNIRSSKMILIRMMQHPAWQEISSKRGQRRLFSFWSFLKYSSTVCLYEKRYPFAITDATPSTTHNEVSLPFAELLISTLRKHQLMMS